MGLTLGRQIIHENAGKPLPRFTWEDAGKLQKDYLHPPTVRPSDFAIAGLRGKPGQGTFTEAHMKATAIAEILWRKANGINGPVLVTKDENPLSLAAFRTAIEVFAAHGVPLMIQAGSQIEGQGYTATPVASFFIVDYNRKAGSRANAATAAIMSASHNPFGQGGAKFNPDNGGPVNADDRRLVNAIIEYMLEGKRNSNIKTKPFEDAIKIARPVDLLTPYVLDLAKAIDFNCVRNAGNIAIDPLGGTALDPWLLIQEKYNLHNLTILNKKHEPLYDSMLGDSDGAGRGDPSSPYAMSGLIKLMAQGDYEMAGANDRDGDRCGFATRKGLMTPNQFFSVVANQLFIELKDKGWKGKKLGKTLVSTMMLDFIAKKLGIESVHMPVGFQNYNFGLAEGWLAFVMEESAGATFINPDGSLSSVDKDGIRLILKGFEIATRKGKTPYQLYTNLTSEFGAPYFERLDGKVDEALADVLAGLKPSDIDATSLAGMQITEKIDRAPGNNEKIGGIKVVLNNGEAFFVLRPSGTERGIVRLYVETIRGKEHFDVLVKEISDLIGSTLERLAGGRK